MEVLSIFTSDQNIIKYFDEFIYSYDKLKLISKDSDTAYFARLETPDRNEIMYHFTLLDPDQEFSYNYSDEDIVILKKIFDNKILFLFDLSYKDDDFMMAFLNNLIIYLKQRVSNLLEKMVISHPHLGLIFIDR